MIVAVSFSIVREPLVTLQTVGVSFLPLSLLATLLIGWWSRRRVRSSNSFLNASRSLPLWIVSAAFLAANCGALEIIGLSAMAAQYGVQAFHFYCIGAIPALIFLSLFMMPAYRKSGVDSLPEYLELRYSRGVRLLNACVLAVMMLLLAGISLYAAAQILQVVGGFGFGLSVTVAAGVVLAYVLLGGIRATIYNEVFQLILIVAGLLPLALRSRNLPGPSLTDLHLHLWHGMPAASSAAPMDGVGVVVGLGFVLSFGYWCSDFILMQRAFAARTDAQARQVPLWAGFGKLFFAFLVVVPGLAAAQAIPALGHTQRFDQALPAMMKLLYGPVLFGLGLSALAASLISGLAGYVSAFAALLTEDIYRARLRPAESERHYLGVGRVATVIAVVVGALASYLNFQFSDLMEHVQMITSIFGSPFWAILLLGMTTKWANARGAVSGFAAGSVAVLVHLAAAAHGWLRYGSVMNANFHGAIYGFCAAIAVTAGVSLLSEPATPPKAMLILHWRTAFTGRDTKTIWILALLLLAASIGLNYAWR